MRSKYPTDYQWHITKINCRWKYTRGYVFDGNFKAESLKMKHPEDDVWLSDGHGFMVTDRPYKEHLKIAKEIKEVCLFHLCIYGLTNGFRLAPVIRIMLLTARI